MGRGNTGYKGITIRRKKGEFAGLNVQVSWKGKVMGTVVSCLSVDAGIVDAIRIRAEFRKKLGAPETERHVRSALGGKPYIKGRNVQVYLGEHVRKFSVAKHGKEQAMQMAWEARQQWLDK